MKILVTGSSGLLGSALKRLNLNSHTYLTPIYCNLSNNSHVRSIITPDLDCVIHCAAVVGGIKMNKEQPAKLFRDNILMNTNIIHRCHEVGIKKLICFSSACAFPDGKYPLKEDMLHDGKPYHTNLAYGYAKRMVDIQIQCYNQQYGTKYLTLIPTSLYGINDNFSLNNGHFIPSLIHKAYLAKINDQPLVVWGDGSPLRELLYVDDMAKIAIKFVENDNLDHSTYLATSSIEVSVKDVALTVGKLMGVKDVVFDTTKQNGQYRKPADPTRLKTAIGDMLFTPYEEGLKTTIKWFLANYPNIRGKNE
jgi:GDP-L-fucose synthase